MRRFALPISLALMISCNNGSTAKTTATNEPNGAKKMGDDACQRAIEDIAKGTLTQWRGWPSTCDLAAVEKLIELEPAVTTTVIGSARVATSHRVAALTGASDPLYVWFRDDLIVKLSIRYPTIDNVPGLLTSLGAPSAKLDTHFVSVPTVNADGEWIYPERGLTLFMSSDKTNVVALSVYPPTTEAHYREALYEFDPPREL